MSASSYGKTGKYEYLTSEEILLPDKRRVIEQAKSSRSSFGKAFWKQIKPIEDLEKKQIKALKKRGKHWLNLTILFKTILI